jgi:predicted glutamine amidotransferase
MGRLIGYMANRTDRLLTAITEEHAAVGAFPSEGAQACGAGFYQGGEILHRKRPRLGGENLRWEDLLGGIRSDTVLIHLREATVGDHRSENTHPFRMRDWLFAHRGTVHGFSAIQDALLAPMPDFLRRNIRGSTDSEHVFHAFLSFLHDRDGLDGHAVDDAVVLASLRSTIALVDRLTGEVGAPSASLDMMLSNGRSLFVVRRGEPIHHVARTLPGETRSSPPYRYVLAVGADVPPPPDYQTLPQAAALIVSRDLELRVETL